MYEVGGSEYDAELIEALDYMDELYCNVPEQDRGEINDGFDY